MFDTSTFLAGGFLIGLVAATWSRIKSLLSRVISYAIVTVEVEDSAAVAILSYCQKHFTRSPYGSKRYRSAFTYVRPESRRLVVAFEALGLATTLFWNKWRPIGLARKQMQANVPSLGSPFPIALTFLRGTFNVDQLIITAVDAYNDSRHGNRPATDDSGDPVRPNRYRVSRAKGNRTRNSQSMYGEPAAPKGASYGDPHEDPDQGPGRRLLKWKDEDLGEPIAKALDPLAYMALNASQDALTKDVERWLASKDWFEERNVPWRMGALLVGKPGTGKSSYVRAVCQRFDLPVFTYDLSTFDNDSFVQRWEEMLSSTPCAAVIEDVDAVFKGRENVTMGETPGLSFDCLLNQISGVAEASGVLLFVTTNHPEFLDPALGQSSDATESGSTRPGRIDRVVEFEMLSLAGRRHIADRILEGYPDIGEALAQKHECVTGAVFEDVCVRAALKLFWDQKV